LIREIFLRYCDLSTLVQIVLIALASSLINCSRAQMEQSPPPARRAIMSGDVAPGVILIDILKSGHPENYWQYEVRPTTGSVRKVKEETFRDYAHEDIPHDFFRPAGAIGGCPSDTKATSFDRTFLAYCAASEGGLVIADTKTLGILFLWKPQEWRGISGFGWSPNSQSIAILNRSSYYGNTPLELLSGKMGHPVPHDTIFLDVLDVRTGKTTEYPVREDVPYSFARILNWSE
jgi:hypothetical protein